MEIKRVKTSELKFDKELLKVAPFAETRLAMHATGRWAEPNWTKLKASDPPKYGYTAFIDDFLFKEVPKHLGVERCHDFEPAHNGDLF